MNDAWGYESNGNEQPGHNDGPKALRDAYEAQKAQNELILAELAEIKKERATEKVANVFTELGVPGAASLYTGEPDPEKAKAWAESMKAAFGNSGTTQGSAPAEVTPSPLSDAETRKQFESMTHAGQEGAPLGNFQAAEAAVGSANNMNDLIAAMAAAQRHSAG